MTPAVSFEVFPPQTPTGLMQLGRTIEALDRVQPEYVSVTYGAGGSDHERSFAAVRTVSNHTDTPVAGHLTCVGQSRSEVLDIVGRYGTLGVRHIVALRGDPAAGIDAAYQPHPDGFASTAELVGAIKDAQPDTSVSVSAYPERHPQSPDFDHDLDVLAAKVEAGADRAMTQMFFDNTHFLRYRDLVEARGIDVRLVPGIFPIHSLETVARFAERCGADIPRRTRDRFEGLEPASADANAVAAQVAAEQISELADHGVDHVHLYTLNKADLALAVCDELNLVSA